MCSVWFSEPYGQSGLELFIYSSTWAAAKRPRQAQNLSNNNASSIPYRSPYQINLKLTHCNNSHTGE